MFLSLEIDGWVTKIVYRDDNEWKGMVQACSAGLSAKINLSTTFGDVVNRIKWVQHPDMICNEAWPGRH